MTFEPRTDATPNPEPHSVTTAVLNARIEAKQYAEPTDNPEPSVSDPIAVRNFCFPLFHHPH